MSRRTTRGEHLANMLSSTRTPQIEDQNSSKNSSRSSRSGRKKRRLEHDTSSRGDAEGSRRTVSFEVNNTSV